jgi:hypothetical protein
VCRCGRPAAARYGTPERIALGLYTELELLGGASSLSVYRYTLAVRTDPAPYRTDRPPGYGYDYIAPGCPRNTLAAPARIALDAPVPVPDTADAPAARSHLDYTRHFQAALSSRTADSVLSNAEKKSTVQTAQVEAEDARYCSYAKSPSRGSTRNDPLGREASGVDLDMD